jgi:hypothetical protein
MFDGIRHQSAVARRAEAQDRGGVRRITAIRV